VTSDAPGTHCGPTLRSVAETAEIRTFDRLVARVNGARSPQAYGQIALAFLEAVDRLEKRVSAGSFIRSRTFARCCWPQPSAFARPRSIHTLLCLTCSADHGKGMNPVRELGTHVTRVEGPGGGGWAAAQSELARS